jgi:hypothetical protein
MQCLPAYVALHRALLCGLWDGMGWHGQGHCPIKQRHGLLADQGIDGIEGVLMRAEHLLQSFPKILEQMKPVRDLRGGRGPLARALGIRTRPIPCDHLHAWMCPEPLGHRLSRPIRQERHRLTALQVHQDRAVGLAFAEGEIVYTKDRGRGTRRDRMPPEQTPQGVATHGQVPGMAETHSGRAAEGDAERDQALGEP